MTIITLRACFHLLTRRMRYRLLLLIPFAILTALLEAMGAVALIGLTKVAANPTTVVLLPMARQIYKLLPAAWSRGNLAIISFTVLFAAVYFTKNTALWAMLHAQSRIATTTMADLSRKVVQGYLHAPYIFFLQRNSADLICNATSTAESVVRNVMLSGVSALSEIMVMLGLVVILISLEPRVTIAAVVMLTILLVAVLFQSRKLFSHLGKQEHGLRVAILGTLQEMIAGIKEIRFLGREDFFEKALSSHLFELTRIDSRIDTYGNAVRLLVETVFVLGILFVIVLVVLEGTSQSMLFPLLSLYAYAGFRIIPSVNRITMHLNSIRRGATAVAELDRDMRLFEEWHNSEPKESGRAGFRLSRDIAFHEVSFSYEAKPPVLDRISLTISQGEFIGIVGATGSGKSTLLNLISGLLVPDSGQVLIDDIELSQIARLWQHRIGYVSQSVFLADTTLRHNIALALHEREIDESSLERCVQLAGLGPMVDRLPHGLDTRVGEHGVQFSGGERQRIAIARALYQDTDLLVLDEPTAALDPLAEQQLVDSIEKLRGKKTILLVSHRLAAISKCERFVMLQGGSMIEFANYRDLVGQMFDNAPVGQV